MIVKFKKLNDMVYKALILNGLSEREARPVTEEILFAEARGKTSHGLNMIETMISRAQKPNDDLRILKDGPTFCLIDGGGKVGPFVAKYAMDKAIEKAKQYAISIVGVRNPSPFLTAGYNAWRAAKYHEMVSINLTVAKSKVAPFGASMPIIGTNPIGFAFPAEPYPIVIDMAITEIPAAEVKLAKKEGRKLPENVAFDSKGNLTIDPDEALSGALIPFGGYKGSALGIFVELMSGALLDAKCGLRNGDLRTMLFIAIKADIFTSFETVSRLAKQLREDVTNNSKDINNKAWLPGDRADKLYRNAIQEGISVPEHIYEWIQNLGKEN